MTLTVRNLTGVEKAGVLMLSLGAEASAKVFDHLSPGERDMLGTEIVRLRHVDEVTRRSVLDEAHDIVKRGWAPAPEIPSPRTECVAEPIGPLRWLERLEPEKVAEMLAGERPSTIALVLSQLSPQPAAAILACLPEKSRNQVVHRLATMKQVSKEAVESVDEALRGKTSDAASDGQVPRKGKALLDVLGGATNRVRESVAATLTRTTPAEAQQLERLFSSPDDITQLTDSEVKAALGAIDFNDLCLALKVAGDDLRETVLRNIPDEAGLALRREMYSASQIRVREIEDAQRRITQTLNELSHKSANTEAAVE